MINLLPLEIIKVNQTNYRLRLLTVGLWLLAIIVMSVIVIDGVRLSTIKIEEQSFAKLVAKPVLNHPTLASTEMFKLNKQLSVLNKLDQPNSHLEQLDQSLLALLSLQPTTVKINQFIYHRAGRERSLTINGLASSREVLVGFVDKLKTWPEVVDLQAPLDNLVKDKNPAFSLVLNLKP